MRLGKRRNKGASLTLSHSKALPEHLAGIVEVSKLYTKRSMRRQGWASRLLHGMCLEADATGRVLMIMPEGEDWLDQFYARFGFATIQTEPVTLMARPPRMTAQ